MKKSFKFLGIALLIARVEVVFSAEIQHLTQADVDLYNANLSARLERLKATAPEAVDEIKAIEMQLKVGGVWAGKISSVTVSKRRNSLKGMIDSERAKLMLSCDQIQDCYSHLVTLFELRIKTQNKLEEIAADIAIVPEPDTLRTGFGLSRETPLTA